MIRPGLTLALWLALALLVVATNAIGDTWIASSLPARAVEWFKVLVPLPYAVLLAAIHARRSAGPRWRDAAFLAALLWPTSTMALDYLYARFTFGDDAGAFLARFAVQWGAPYPLLIAALAAAPMVAGRLASNRAPLSGQDVKP